MKRWSAGVLLLSRTGDTIMKRWSVLLLLLLLPLTMAPRTSISPVGSDLELTAVVSKTEVRPGTPVNYVLQVRNATDRVLERPLVDILIGWDGKSDEVLLTGSSQCAIGPDVTGFIASCGLDTLDPGEMTTLRIQARPLVTGQLTFQVRSDSGLGGPVPGVQTIVVDVRE